MRGEKNEEITITGIVVPADWDDNDTIIQIAIQTTNEDEYLVDQNKNGAELLEFIEWEVEVTGVARTDEDGNKIIKVSEYSLI